MKEKTEEEKKEEVLKELKGLIKETEDLQRQYEEMKKQHPEIARTKLGDFFEEPKTEEDGNN